MACRKKTTILRNLRICSQPSFQLYFLPFPCAQSRHHQHVSVFQKKLLLGVHFSTFSRPLNSTPKPSSQVIFSGKPAPTFPMLKSADFFPIPPWQHRRISIQALVTFPREYLLMCLPSNPVFEGCTSLYLWCLGNSRHG